MDMERLDNHLNSGEVDWIGRWFTVAKERGINVTATLGKIDLKTNKVDWNHFCHSTMDGAGAMIKWIRDHGHETIGFPESREKKQPNLWKRPSIIYKTLKSMKKKNVAWKEQNMNFEMPDNREMDWIVFRPNEVMKLTKYAKKRKLSQNSYLLYKMNSLLLPLLLKENDSGGWMFPTNMRGPVYKTDRYCNHSSAITIYTDLKTTGESIHKQIKKELERGIHWGNWYLGHIGKIVGMKGMRKMSKKSAGSNFNFGTFTNMGSWPLPGTKSLGDFNQDEAYVCAPPGTVSYPISVGLITWNGNLSISFKIHPMICSDRSFPKRFIDDFKVKILDEID